MSRVAFIELCLPSPSDRPPFGANFVDEIKHDGFRLMACDPVGIRLLTLAGQRLGFPLSPRVAANPVTIVRKDRTVRVRGLGPRDRG
jgi:hypothetical protein